MSCRRRGLKPFLSYFTTGTLYCGQKTDTVSVHDKDSDAGQVLMLVYLDVLVPNHLQHLHVYVFCTFMKQNAEMISHSNLNIIHFLIPVNDNMCLQSCLSWCSGMVGTRWRDSFLSFLWTLSWSVLSTEAGNRKMRVRPGLRHGGNVCNDANKLRVYNIVCEIVPVLSSVEWFLERTSVPCGECRASAGAWTPTKNTWAVFILEAVVRPTRM